MATKDQIKEKFQNISSNLNDLRKLLSDNPEGVPIKTFTLIERVCSAFQNNSTHMYLGEKYPNNIEQCLSEAGILDEAEELKEALEFSKG